MGFVHAHFWKTGLSVPATSPLISSNSAWLSALTWTSLGTYGGGARSARTALRSRDSNHSWASTSSAPCAPRRSAGSFASSRFEKFLNSKPKSRVVCAGYDTCISCVAFLTPSSSAGCVRKGDVPQSNSKTVHPKPNQSTAALYRRWCPAASVCIISGAMYPHVPASPCRSSVTWTAKPKSEMRVRPSLSTRTFSGLQFR
mmetsp:Transcript_41253/g.129232  ORF Transcript_41253/g.129232 Transcript_41253/m.129232 type:complete len:200 (-) Transcript_41253:1672-2271(-)